jgi:hypothetical protein
MDHEVLKGFTRIGLFVGGGGLILLLFEPRDSPEWVISLCSAIIGVALLAGVAILSRWRR